MTMCPVKSSSLMMNANAMRYSAAIGAIAVHTFHCSPAARFSATQRFTGGSRRTTSGRLMARIW